MNELTKAYLDLINASFEEDLGQNGDVSSLAVFEEAEKCEAYLLSKDDGILAGSEGFTLSFTVRDPETILKWHKKDGDKIAKSDVVVSISGRTLSVLTAERTAINIIGFLSGIASETNKFVSAIASGSKCKILDTRKTLPWYRLLSKYAVKMGGGLNHRMGLHDMVMLKDNHIDAAGSIAKAVTKVRGKWGNRFKIEVEARTIDEVKQALEVKTDYIMLDNMNNQIMKECVELIGGNAKVEASGNMTLDRIQSVSAIGVDYISVGKLTHSVITHDFSLRVQK
ncbi:MAG TPA: carboxylating nicotinate-nucleotide diphosphorylase [Lentisphaeria bacterium]|nr:MAG: nicotinate-nucleotide diphosphorylase (carboxylating) [Lentisphaerae bacterium GWF2_38_69]HBM14835.1 carboxylating nicotinate-nucleotide diphosphorylase [Lentisphaeria bacterium]